MSVLILLLLLSTCRSFCERLPMSFSEGLNSSPGRITSSPVEANLLTSSESDTSLRFESSPLSRVESSPLCSGSSSLGFSPFGPNLRTESEFHTPKRRRLSFSCEIDAQQNEDSPLGSACPHSSQESNLPPGRPALPAPSVPGSSDESDIEPSTLLIDSDSECLEEDTSPASSIITSESDTENESDTCEYVTNDKAFDNDLLYENSSVTVEEAIVDLCDIFIKNRLSKTALGDMLKFLNQILPEVNGMPRSTYELFTFIRQKASAVTEVAHSYCSECFAFKHKRDDVCQTEGCNAETGNFFYEFPLEQQLVFLFEKGGLAEAVDEFHQTRVVEEGIIKDICDGSEVRNLKRQFYGRYDITLLWNTDGIALGPTHKIWPVLFTICEIPARLRAYYIWVSMLWYDVKEPPMKMFLQPFVNSLVAIINQGGLQWTHPKTKEKITSQVIAPCAVADAPARSKLQDIKNFNAINGCNMCEITCSVVLVDGKKRYYYVFSENPAKLRSGKRMIKQAESALSVRNGSVLGVKGLSVLYPVPHLDLGKFLFPEYMHAVALGCVLSFTVSMINMDVDWRLKKKLSEIDQIIKSLKVPDFLKNPQGLKQITKFKAHELRAWLLYLSLPVLSSFLPEKYLQHWILLVGAICLLLQERISENDLTAADIMLRMFVRDVGNLYGNTGYRYNTHQLLHLVLTVRRWGPLWANSAFIFENFNGILTRMIHGTKHVAKELVVNLQIAKGLMVLKSTVAKNVTLRRDVLGRDVEFVFSETELASISGIDSGPYQTYLRAQVGKTIFSCKQYDDKVKNCNSFVTLEGDEIAQVVCFVKFTRSKEIWCLMDLYAVDHTQFFVHKATRFVVNHIVPVMENPRERIFVPIAKLNQKVIRVLNYVCICPNTIEVKL